MNRKSLFIAGSLLIAGLAGQAAQAHQWGCWIQTDRNIKIRNAGFHECLDTEEMFVTQLKDLQRRKILPP